MFANDVVDDSLVERERIEALLFDLGAGIGRRVEEDVIGDPLVIFAIGLAGRRAEDADSEAGVAGGRVCDAIELIVGDDVLVKAPLRTSLQDVVELFVVVAVHPDVLAGAKSTHEALVDTTEQLSFLVGDANERDLREAMEIVDDAGVFELVDLVENYDSLRAVILLKSIDKFVVGVDWRWMSMVLPRSSRIW